MALLPIILSLFALCVVSMDLALATIWRREAGYSWRKSVIVFCATLLGAVCVYVIELTCTLIIPEDVMEVLSYIFSAVLIGDSGFLIGAIPFFSNWIVARPTSAAEKVVPFFLAGIYVAFAILNVLFPILIIFQILCYISWIIDALYCLIILLSEFKNVESKLIRAVMLSLMIVSFALTPVLVLSIFFTVMRGVAIPLSVLSYSIVVLVFFYIALCRSEATIDKTGAVSHLGKEVMDKWHITERECEIIKLIKEGLTNKEIASELSISDNTVKNHIANIFAKTEVRSRIDLLNLLEEASW